MLSIPTTVHTHRHLLAQAVDAPAFTPCWPAVPGVYALCSQRSAGWSQPPYASLNLGAHVGDDPQAVAANRQRWAALIQAHGATDTPPAQPVFLEQVHGTAVLELGGVGTGVVGAGALLPAQAPVADACLSTQPGWACTIMVADCLPVLWVHRSSRMVAAAHAGWRGLAAGVLEAVWQQLCQRVRSAQAPQAGITQATEAQIAADTQIWLGPCIGLTAFEVGQEVRQAFMQHSAQSAAYFAPTALPDKWLADLAGLARLRLQAMGMSAVYGNDGSPAWCTVGNPLRFFSHRRDGAGAGAGLGTGRMAVSIWRD